MIMFGTALIVPLHISTGDGALFLNISYHRFFFQTTLERGMADSNSIPFLYLYTNRHEFVELYWQKIFELWQDLESQPKE